MEVVGLLDDIRSVANYTRVFNESDLTAFEQGLNTTRQFVTDLNDNVQGFTIDQFSEKFSDQGKSSRWGRAQHMANLLTLRVWKEFNEVLKHV